MKKAFIIAAGVITVAFLIILLVSVVSVGVFILQGNFTEALNSFYNILYAVLALLMISALADAFGPDS